MNGRESELVTLICDGGERYAHTYDSESWLAGQAPDITPWTKAIESVVETGEWAEPYRAGPLRVVEPALRRPCAA